MNTALKQHTLNASLRLIGSPLPRDEEVLTPEALALLDMLHRRFDCRRLELLSARVERQRRIDYGEMPDFLPETAKLRQSDWRIEPLPPDLLDRRVEITGPVDRKMIINALNAPVQAFMADFEDSTSPTWRNIINGQINLKDAVDGHIRFEDRATGKCYRLHDRTATLMVRPRGWHLPEKHVRIDGKPVSAALFDFALFFANNYEALLRKGTGPYFYLPKIESHLEARLWNDVFIAAQDELGIPRGTIKATVLIETILAAFEMDEILYELREHAAGLNCGRWDYIFSFIKKLRNYSRYVLPDRATVTMDKHFLKSYVELLVRTCHRRGAHAMGGMAAHIPIRDDAAANEAALANVRADKEREVKAGHDGTWIAHPGLASVVQEVFERAAPNQLHVARSDVKVSAADLLSVPEGRITEQGARHNLRVGVQYLAAWLDGLGCVPLYHLMEDAATAEISRAQLWQWVHHEVRTSDGRSLTPYRVEELLAEELEGIRLRVGVARFAEGSFATAARMFGYMVTSDDFDDFLTLPAYDFLP